MLTPCPRDEPSLSDDFAVVQQQVADVMATRYDDPTPWFGAYQVRPPSSLCAARKPSCPSGGRCFGQRRS
jgi:hypothetical protein